MDIISSRIEEFKNRVEEIRNQAINEAYNQTGIRPPITDENGTIVTPISQYDTSNLSTTIGWLKDLRTRLVDNKAHISRQQSNNLLDEVRGSTKQYLQALKEKKEHFRDDSDNGKYLNDQINSINSLLDEAEDIINTLPTQENGSDYGDKEILVYNSRLNELAVRAEKIDEAAQRALKQLHKAETLNNQNYSREAEIEAERALNNLNNTLRTLSNRAVKMEPLKAEKPSKFKGVSTNNIKPIAVPDEKVYNEKSKTLNQTRKHAQEQLQNNIANNQAQIKKIMESMWAFDTETTGRHAKNDGSGEINVPVTLGLASATERLNYFLSYGEKNYGTTGADKTIENIVKAMNLKDEKGKLIESSKHLRERLGVKHTNDVDSKEITKEVWEKKILPNLITPEELGRILNDRGIISQNTVGFNNVEFDWPMLQNWLGEYIDNTYAYAGKEERAALKQNLANQISPLDTANDVRKLLIDTMTKRRGDGLIAGLEGEPILGGVGNTTGRGTLQSMIKLISGSTSSGAHDAADDAYHTLELYANANAAQFFEIVKEALQVELNNAVEGTGAFRTSDGKAHYTQAFHEAVNNTLDALTGMGVPDYVDDKAKTYSARKQVEELVNQFGDEQKASILGHTTREIFKQKSNVNVDKLTGIGYESAGTSAYALTQLVQKANDMGMQVIFRKSGENEIQAMIMPNDEYEGMLDDESKINEAWNSDNQIKVAFQVGRNGVIGANGDKVNKNELVIEWVPNGEFDSNGNPKYDGQVKMITHETGAIEAVNRALGYLDLTESRSYNSQRLQSSANRVINNTIPTSSPFWDKESAYDSYKDIEVTDNRELLAQRQTEVGYTSLLQGLIYHDRVQDAIKNFYRKYDVNGELKANNFDPRNPPRDVLTSLINLINGMSVGRFDENTIKNLSDNDMLKMMLTDDAFAFIRNQVQQIVNTFGGFNWTSMADRKFGDGVFNVTSSRELSPYGVYSAFEQRSVSQGFNTAHLTNEAIHSRIQALNQQNSGVGIRHINTRKAQDIGVNLANNPSDLDKARYSTYPIYHMKQSELDDLYTQYFAKKHGVTIDELQQNQALLDQLHAELPLLEDGIIVAQDLINQMDSYQNRSSQNTALEDIHIDFLKKTLGFTDEDIKDMIGSEVGDYFSLDATIDDNSWKSFSDRTSLSNDDRVTGLIRGIDGWQLKYEKKLEVSKEKADAIKFATSGGNRVTKIGNEEFSNYVFDYLKQKGINASAVIEDSDIKWRNSADFFEGTLENMVNAATEAGASIDEVYNILTNLDKFTGTDDENEKRMLANISEIFSRMFGVRDGELIHRGMYDTESGAYVNEAGELIFGKGEEAVKNTTDMLQKLVQIGNIILNQFGNGQDYSQISANGRITRMGLGLHDVAYYENPTGYANLDTLEREGRVSNDYKVDRARERNFRTYARALGDVTTDDEVKAGLVSLEEQMKAANSVQSNQQIYAENKMHELASAHHSLIGNKNLYSTDDNSLDVELITQKTLEAQGKEKSENQLIVDELREEFNQLVETGELKENQWADFLMETTRNLRESLVENAKDKETADKYRNGNIVFNADGSVQLGDRKYLLVDIEGSKTQVSMSDRANANFVRKALDVEAGKNTNFDKAREDLANVYTQLRQKGGALYDAQQHRPIPYSSFGRAMGTSKFAELSDAQANTVQMSSEMVRGLLKTVQSGSEDDYRANIQNLFQQFDVKHDEANANVQFIYDDLKDKIQDLSNKSLEELIEIEHDLIEGIIADIKGGNNQYAVELGRYPYTQGLEGHKSRVAIDDNLDTGVFKLSAGALQMLRGDTDGDRLRAAMVMSYEKFGEEEYKAEQVLLEISDAYVGFLNNVVKRTAEDSNITLTDEDRKNGISLSDKLEEKKNEALSELAKEWENPSQGYKASEEAKRSFQYIGQFSDISTKMRESMAHLGYDELNPNDDESVKRNQYADVIRAFTEILEQDAISSKKIYARLTKENKAKGMANDEAEQQAIASVVNLLDALRSGRIEEALDMASDLGIWESEAGVRQIQSMRAKWFAIDKVRGNVVNGELTNQSYLRRMAEEFNMPGFADLTLGEKGSGFNRAMLGAAFANFDEFLKGKSLSFADAVRYSKKIDPDKMINGLPREDQTYTIGGGSGGSGNNGGPPKNPDGTDGSIGSIHMDGGSIVINTSGNVEVNGATINVNGNQINNNNNSNQSNNTANNTKQSTTDVKGYDLKDATGQYKIVQANKQNANEPLHVTEIQGQYHYPMSPYDFSGNKASSLGNVGHKINELLVKEMVDTYDQLSDVAKQEIYKMELEARKPYESGGAGMNVTREELDQRRVMAETNYKLAKDLGLLGNSQAEKNILFSMNGQSFSGTADLLSFVQGDSGLEAVVGDWKFSKNGGEDDPGQRAFRVLQASTYLRAFEEKYKEALDRVNNGDTLSDAEIQDLGLQGNTVNDQMNDLANKVDAFNRGRIAIIRAFVDKDGQIIHDILQGNALSLKTVGEQTEHELNHQGVDIDKILAENNGITSYYNNQGNSIDTPDFILDNMGGTSSKQQQRNFDRYTRAYENLIAKQRQLSDISARQGIVGPESVEWHKLEEQRIKLINDEASAIDKLDEARLKLHITEQDENEDSEWFNKLDEKQQERFKRLQQYKADSSQASGLRVSAEYFDSYRKNLNEQYALEEKIHDLENKRSLLDENDAKDVPQIEVIDSKIKSLQDTLAQTQEEAQELVETLQQLDVLETDAEGNTKIKEVSDANEEIAYWKERAEALTQDRQKHDNRVNEIDTTFNANQEKAQLAKNSDVQRNIKAYREMHQLMEDQARLQVVMQGQSGDDLLANQRLNQTIQSRINTLKQITDQYDAQNKELNGQKLTNEEIQKIEEARANDDSKFEIDMDAINASIGSEESFLDKVIGGFKNQFAGFIDTSLAYQAIGEIRSIIREIISTTKELDAAMVDIQIATGNTREETRQLLLEYNKLADELGRTTQEVAQASNDWLRAGYEGQEAAELTRASMMLSTLGMIDASEATTYLISTLKGWQIEASEVINVVDKLSVTICGVCTVMCIGHKLKSR